MSNQEKHESERTDDGAIADPPGLGDKGHDSSAAGALIAVVTAFALVLLYTVLF